jgi:hypothetical protein
MRSLLNLPFSSVNLTIKQFAAGGFRAGQDLSVCFIHGVRPFKTRSLVKAFKGGYIKGLKPLYEAGDLKFPGNTDQHGTSTGSTV